MLGTHNLHPANVITAKLTVDRHLEERTITVRFCGASDVNKQPEMAGAATPTTGPKTGNL
jgi:hypothetical protein